MKKKLQYQGYHLLAFLLLGGLLYHTILVYPDGETRFWKLSSSQWIWFSWIFAGIFQFWIAFFWRLELYGGRISAWMGRAGFSLYRTGYVVFGLLRLLPLIPIALTSRGTASVPAWISLPFLALTIPLSLWGMYCATVYFGITRASGADHFIPAYRDKNLEKRGIYKYIPNVMYTVVLLALYHPGLIWQSAQGIIAAAAHHAFVWVHYFCTEKPDLKEIYGNRPLAALRRPESDDQGA
ncbi:hypothetical protein D1BOALGB6SA_2468 [Olavius sp. associated proteobacterium Delta 1]|nr:hypothetical protein D1BOALGB6SA_2468 [Olavius sp. associated proteobacterium Delta 1]